MKKAILILVILFFSCHSKDVFEEQECYFKLQTYQVTLQGRHILIDSKQAIKPCSISTEKFGFKYIQGRLVAYRVYVLTKG